MNAPAMTPMPEPTPESQPYWDGLLSHRLLLQRCTNCGKIRHYPRPVCPSCFSMEHDWKEASGRGKLHSWTVTHQAFHPSVAGATPYILAMVDLDEGVRMLGRLRDAKAEQLKIGKPVRVVFHDINPELVLPEFELAALS